MLPRKYGGCWNQPSVIINESTGALCQLQASLIRNWLDGGIER